MRVIFQTKPVPAGNVQPPNDAVIPGIAYFEVVLYEPSDGDLGKGQQTAAYWHAAARTTGTVRIPAGPKLVGLPDAVVPASVFESLPPDARLLLSYRWERTT